jgi:hypothetical protein
MGDRQSQFFNLPSGSGFGFEFFDCSPVTRHGLSTEIFPAEVLAMNPARLKKLKRTSEQEKERRLFAAMAMEALISTLTIGRQDHTQSIAKTAVDYADALILQLMLRDALEDEHESSI